MPAVLEQSSTQTRGGYPSTSASFSTTPTVGNTVIVHGTWGPRFGPAPTAVAVFDNQGNSYTVILQNSGSPMNRGAWIAYAEIETASGTFTVTATPNNSADAGSAVLLQEWSGLDNAALLDKQGGFTGFFGAGTDQIVTASAANAAADRVVVAVMAVTDGATYENSPPLSGYTNALQFSTGGFGDALGVSAYKTVSSVETSSADWGEVTGVDQSAIILATFAVAAGGAELAADGGTFTYTGGDAGIQYGRQLAADGGSYAFTGGDAALTVGRQVAADGASYAYTGGDAGLTVSRTFAADGAACAFTGGDAGLELGARLLAAEGGVFAFTGGEAILSYSGQTPVRTFPLQGAGQTYPIRAAQTYPLRR